MLKKLSHSFTALFILLFMLLILIIPDICISGASSGLLLWFHKLLPSLLPFIILINMLCYLGVIFKLSYIIHPLSYSIFRVSGTSFIIFIMGLIAGYPMGAKLTKQLLDAKQISLDEAQKALCFSTNCGPLFIIGTVGTLMLNNVSLGYFIAFVHIISSLFMLVLSRFYKLKHNATYTSSQPQTSPAASFSEAFSRSVQNGMDTIVCVGGYIIFFSMIINILSNSTFFNNTVQFISSALPLSPETLYQLTLGSLEFSNGSALLCNTQPFTLHHLALLTALITFGGFCVFFQCSYVLHGSNLKLSIYLISKLLQSCIAYVLTLILYPSLVEHMFHPSFKPILTLFILCLITACIFKHLSRSTEY